MSGTAGLGNPFGIPILQQPEVPTQGCSPNLLAACTCSRVPTVLLWLLYHSLPLQLHGSEGDYNLNEQLWAAGIHQGLSHASP